MADQQTNTLLRSIVIKAGARLLFAIFLIPIAIFSFAQSPCDTTRKDNAGFATDTTIVLENGTTLTFNRCDFFDVRNCISFREIRTTDDVLASGLTTMDNQGNVLLSCGMFAFDIDANECEKKCLNYPVRIRIPVLNGQCASSADGRALYVANDIGLWMPSQMPSKIVTGKDGKESFEFETVCSGKFNCDRRMQTYKVKFKARHMEALKKIEVTSRCPLMNTWFNTKKHRSNIVIAEIPCLDPDSINIKATVIDKNGGEKIISCPLSKLRTKYFNSGCDKISNRVMRTVLGIFKMRQRNVYRKYIVE